MIIVAFKNLEKSELARDAVIERLDHLVDKFENLKVSHIRVTLEMENSPTQAGPDLFSVKVQVRGGIYDGVKITKSSSSLYVALADVADHLLEVLNRFTDKLRVKNRSRARKYLKQKGLLRRVNGLVEDVEVATSLAMNRGRRRRYKVPPDEVGIFSAWLAQSVD